MMDPEIWEKYYTEPSHEPMSDFDRLHYAWLRLYVVAIHRPFTPIVRWLAARLP